MSRIRGSETRGAPYGGRILNEGAWSDFFLHPSDGIDEALRQQGQGVDIQLPFAVTEHAFEGDLDLAYRNAAEVTEQKRKEGFGLLRSTSH